LKLTKGENMKYIIIKKWKMRGAKASYYLEEVTDSIEEANRKLSAHNVLKRDENDSFYIVPFNEEVLVLDKLAS
jgi:hypothetical protein